MFSSTSDTIPFLQGTSVQCGAVRFLWKTPGSCLLILIHYHAIGGLPGGPVVKNPPANAGDTGSIPGSGRCPAEGNGNSFQCSCLGNPMDRGAWWATVHGVIRVRDS